MALDYRVVQPNSDREMAVVYHDEETSHLRLAHAWWPLRKLAVAIGVSTAIALTLAGMRSSHLVPVSNSARRPLSLAGLPCSKLWGQCGGEGYSGPTCCEANNVCQKHPVPSVPSFEQCRPPPPPICEDAKPGSECYRHVMWDMNVGIHQNQGWYHGLSAKSGFKEFQEYEYSLNREKSQCKQPCSPGTCFFVFRFEGCDDINEWTCESPNDSLAFKCCCEYFHGRVNKALPEHPSPQLKKVMKAVTSPTPVLFCTAMMLPFGYEVGLLRAQYANGKIGVFACDHFAVYSNKTVLLSKWGQLPVVGTQLINGSMARQTGGEFNTVLNTRVFMRFWNKVITNKQAQAADWVVKLDPDTVFVPVRLKALLLSGEGLLGGEPPEKGLFINNCHVGMHGPIEVVSKTALRTYAEGHRKCEIGKPAEHGQEDWYLRSCFEYLGIWKVNAYNVLLEGTYACQERPSSINPYRPPCFAPQVAFHPFKSVESYMHCWNETANHPWALPTGPIGEGPTAANELHG